VINVRFMSNDKNKSIIHDDYEMVFFIFMIRPKILIYFEMAMLSRLI
jgi:hypothetical protein